MTNEGHRDGTTACCRIIDDVLAARFGNGSTHTYLGCNGESVLGACLQAATDAALFTDVPVFGCWLPFEDGKFVDKSEGRQD